jgi:hypothetical protein
MLLGYLRFDQMKVTPAIRTMMDRMITVPTTAAV